jgi:glycosyltransferase involved in cell wall biosynthesis
LFKVCHLTSVHPRNDVRVFHKECISLASAGYDTTLVVADGLGNQFINGVSISDVGVPSNRISRIFITTLKVLKVGKQKNADVYHFHDPELFIVGAILSFSGKKVVFDVHENIVEQIKDKSWLPKVLRFFASILFKIFNFLATRFFAIVIAEKSYEKIYGKHKSKFPVTTIFNYPNLESLKEFRSFQRKGSEFFYIGGVSNQRGLDVILAACSILKNKGYDFKVHLVGGIMDEDELNKYPDIQDNVFVYGRKDFFEGYMLSKKCVAGLALLKPIGNYIQSYPTKIFEYMSIGLPVITSDFDLYKKIVLSNNVGVCVDPTSPEDIASEMIYFIDSKHDVTLFGKNGVKAIKQRYSWRIEEKKLLNLYDKLLKNEY